MELIIKIQQKFTKALLNDNVFDLKFPNANIDNVSIGFKVFNQIENNDLATFHSLVLNDLNQIFSDIHEIDRKTIEIAYDDVTGFAKSLYGISINQKPDLIAFIL
jgi:hypothetical protein